MQPRRWAATSTMALVAGGLRMLTLSDQDSTRGFALKWLRVCADNTLFDQRVRRLAQVE